MRKIRLEHVLCGCVCQSQLGLVLFALPTVLSMLPG